MDGFTGIGTKHALKAGVEPKGAGEVLRAARMMRLTVCPTGAMVTGAIYSRRAKGRQRPSSSTGGSRETRFDKAQNRWPQITALKQASMDRFRS